MQQVGPRHFDLNPEVTVRNTNQRDVFSGEQPHKALSKRTTQTAMVLFKIPFVIVVLCVCVDHVTSHSFQNSPHVDLLGLSTVDSSDTAALTAVETESLLYAARKPVIVTVGDSQTAFGSYDGGWVNKLYAAYGSSADVLNKGMGMGTTRHGKILVEKIVKPLCEADKIGEQVKLVTICFGSNDASPVMNNVSRRMVSLQEYQQNLDDTVNMLQSSGVKNIVLITAPPRGNYPPSVYAPYTDAMLAVGAAKQVPVANFFEAVSHTPDWVTELLRSDKLHLTAKGNQLLFDTVMDTIQRSLPAVAPKALLASASFMTTIPYFSVVS